MYILWRSYITNWLQKCCLHCWNQTILKIRQCSINNDWMWVDFNRLLKQYINAAPYQALESLTESFRNTVLKHDVSPKLLLDHCRAAVAQRKIRAYTNQKVWGLMPGCSSPNGEVSLSKTQDPKLLLTFVLAPCEVACHHCCGVWLGRRNFVKCFGLRRSVNSAIYLFPPFY